MNLRTLIRRIPHLALLFALASGHTVRAEESSTAAAVPARGMTMTAVEQSFGKPVEILPAVGSPPITRWIYPTCTVYFEHQYVIHSVVPRPPKS
jgi:hypothetical protein